MCTIWAELREFLPTYQSKTRAFSILPLVLHSYHLHLSKEYFIKANSLYSVNGIKSWYKKVISQFGIHRPNWTAYVSARTRVATTHMTNWNLHLVNAQRTARDHGWNLKALAEERRNPPRNHGAALDDLVRIPANSNSRFDLESQSSGQEQLQECHVCSWTV